MNACRHTYRPSGEHPEYEVCCACGTLHSLTAPLPLDVYTADYWTPENGHSTLEEQVYNCAEHLENGISKVDFVASLIDAPDWFNALDIGCAPGAMMRRLLLDKAVIVDGVEVPYAWDDAICEVAGKRVDIWHGVFPHLSAKLCPNWYNLILALDVIEHSHEPEAFLAECARLLREDGQLILMLPLIGPDLPERFFSPIEHVYIHDPTNLTMMLEDAGLEVECRAAWCPGHEVVTARKPVDVTRYLDEDPEGNALPCP